MKTRNIYLNTLIAIISLCACHSEEVTPTINTATGTLTVKAEQAGNTASATKTTITPTITGLSVTWAEGDQIRIIQSATDTQASTVLSLSDGAGEQTATFTGQSLPTPATDTPIAYQAFYPALNQGDTPEAWKSNATYIGQIQNGYDNTEHLANFDYLITPEIETLTNTLRFAHAGMVFCFDLTLPTDTDAVPLNLTLTTIDDQNMPTTEGGLYQNCNAEKTSILTLGFTGIETINERFKAYMMCNCQIAVNQKLLLTLTLKNGNRYAHTLTAQQAIGTTASDKPAAGISYVIPVEQWEEIKADAYTDNISSTEFSTGDGTEANPYLINNAKEFKYFASNYSKAENLYYRLTTDISISDQVEWKAIGASSTTKFNGHFDGNGHIIKGTLKDSSNEEAFGIFGYTEDASISNLTVIADITQANNKIGGIVANASNTTVSNCHYIGTITYAPATSQTSIGGIVAYATNTCKITTCSVNGHITPATDATFTQNIVVGGIIGYSHSECILDKCNNYAEIRGGIASASNLINIGGIIGQTAITAPKVSGTLSECRNYGKIYGGSSGSTTSYTGGIVGQANYISITNTYNHADVSVPQTNRSCYTGGICGQQSKNATLLNCTNSGNIIGYAKGSNTSYTGGISGYIGTDGGHIHQCHNCGNVSVTNASTSEGNIYTGSYAGNINENAYVYRCCTTAPGVEIKDKDGTSVSPDTPSYYIGNGIELTDCPEKHPSNQ